MPQKQVVLDTNLLLLLAVGETDPALIHRHKRLQTYDMSDLDSVQQIIQASAGLLLCPNVLSETSNLARYTHERDAFLIAATLKIFAEQFSESYVPSRSAVTNPIYLRLGLTDSVLMHLAAGQAQLITDDLDLAVAAERFGMDVINYSHVRQRRY